MDPVVSGILRAVLGWIFAQAAYHKLRDPAAFDAIVRGYRLVPDAVAPLITLALAMGEIVAVAALLMPGLVGYGGAIGVLLLSVYSVAIGTNLLRGRRDVDCGCLGPLHRQPLSGWLLVRNGLLGVAALLCAVPTTPRALGWLDAVTLVGGTWGLALLFTTVARLGVTAPASARLGRSR